MNARMHLGRRRFARAAIEATAQVAAGLGVYPATVKQISEGGLRLETTRELPDTAAIVVFDLPGFGEQRIVAEICSKVAAPRGYGCRFTEMPPETQTRIAAYVQKMRTLYADLQLAFAMNKPRSHYAAILRELKLDHLTDMKELKDAVARARNALHSASR